MRIGLEYVRTNICMDIEFIGQMLVSAWGYDLWKSM